MAREPAPDPLRERVAVCADELPGLEPAEIFGELARGRVAAGASAMALVTIAARSRGAPGSRSTSGWILPVVTRSSMSARVVPSCGPVPETT